MSNFDVILLSISNILRNKLKFLLTMISICIGISSVMIISTISGIGTQIIEQEFDSMGIDGLAITNKYSDVQSVLSDDIIISIEQNFEDISCVMPIISEFGTYTHNTKTGQALVFGVDEKLYDTLQVKSLFGEGFSHNNIKYGENVCVIDENLANELYKRTNIIGKAIEVNLKGKTTEFEIIGIISNQKAMVDSFLGENAPSFIYIPYTCELIASPNYSQIAIRADDNSDLEKIEANLQYYLSKKSDLDGKISIKNINSYIDVVGSVMGVISVVLGAVASISLVVAAIGVSNMMFSSAVERKKEIGIYMALGAKKQVISKIFLMESVFICLFSGVIGVIIGIIIGALLSKLLAVQFIINGWHIGIIFAISIFCGIISGIAPAIKASKLNPIDILRE